MKACSSCARTRSDCSNNLSVEWRCHPGNPGWHLLFLSTACVKVDYRTVTRGNQANQATVRAATVDDIELICRVGEQTFRETYSRYNDPASVDLYVERSFSATQIRAELQNPHSWFFILEERHAGDVSSTALGYAKLRIVDVPVEVSGRRPVELERIYVLRDYHGQGLGATLMSTAMDAARDLDCDVLWLGVWSKNEQAVDFYRKWRFEVVGTKTFMFGDDPQHDYVMQAQVASGETIRAKRERKASDS